MRVGRRDVLRGAASAVAAAGAERLLVGCDADTSLESFEAIPTEKSTLHVDVAPAFLEAALTLETAYGAFPLSRHDTGSRSRYRDDNAFLRALTDDQLDFFAKDAVFSSISPQIFTITYQNRDHDPADHRRGLVHAGIHLPSGAVERARDIMGPDFKLRPRSMVGKLRPLADTDVDADDIRSFVDWTDSAHFAVYHHPELLSLSSETAAIVLGIIDSLEEMDAVVQMIKTLGPAQGPDSQYLGWANAEWSVDFEGNRLPRLGADGAAVRDALGNVVYEFDWIPDPALRVVAGKAIRAALLKVRNTPQLESRSYVVADGVHAAPPASDLPADGGLLRAGATKLGFGREGEWRYGQRVAKEALDEGSVVVRVDNSYFRHLAVWATFKDAAGNLLKLADLGVQQQSRDTVHARYLGMIDPPPRIMGAPVIGAETYERYTIPLPPGASRVCVVTGALATSDGDLRGEYATLPVPSLGMTYAFEIGFPMFFLAMGAASQFFKAALGKFAIAVGPQVVAAAAQYFVSVDVHSAAERPLSTNIGLKFVNIVTKKLVGGAVGLFAELVAAAAAERVATLAAPVVGWVMWAVDAAVTTAEVATTVADICLARSAVETEGTLTHDIVVKIQPDPNHAGAYPQVAKTLEVTLLFTGAKVHKVQRAFDPVSEGGELTVRFDGMPAGGAVTVNVQFLSDSRWIAGQASTRLDNKTPEGARELLVPLRIEENKVPLDASTKYFHLKKLAVANGKHVWQRTSEAPQATRRALDCRPAAAALCAPGAITYATRLGQLAYAYQAAAPSVSTCGAATTGSQVYLIQSLNDSPILGDGSPDAGLKVLTCGYTRPVHVVYDLLGENAGAHFALVPAKRGYTLRKLDLGQADVFTRVEQAPIYGVFSSDNIASVRYHTSGYVVAINSDFDKIEILQLPREPAPVPELARRADLIVGRGATRGLIDGAVAIACTYSGRTFLVLEAGNRRLQALDEVGNPVKYFGSGDDRSCFAALRPEAGVKYLDVAMEATGYIYVLSHLGDGATANDYRVDIYEPEGGWLARTEGIASAKIAVDFWRNLFTLNFEQIVGPGGRTEPSVSEWIPSTP